MYITQTATAPHSQAHWNQVQWVGEAEYWLNGHNGQKLHLNQNWWFYWCFIEQGRFKPWSLSFMTSRMVVANSTVINFLSPVSHLVSNSVTLPWLTRTSSRFRIQHNSFLNWMATSLAIVHKAQKCLLQSHFNFELWQTQSEVPVMHLGQVPVLNPVRGPPFPTYIPILPSL